MIVVTILSLSIGSLFKNWIYQFKNVQFLNKDLYYYVLRKCSLSNVSFATTWFKRKEFTFDYIIQRARTDMLTNQCQLIYPANQRGVEGEAEGDGKRTSWKQGNTQNQTGSSEMSETGDKNRARRLWEHNWRLLRPYLPHFKQEEERSCQMSLSLHCIWIGHVIGNTWNEMPMMDRPENQENLKTRA